MRASTSRRIVSSASAKKATRARSVGRGVWNENKRDLENYYYYYDDDDKT